MKKVSLVVHRPYQNNEIFNPNSRLNRDNCLEFFHCLRSEFAVCGYDLVTHDKCSDDEASLIIYNEMPLVLPSDRYRFKSSVLLFESELIRRDNWDRHKHSHFSHIFTWNDDWVDGVRYHKFNFCGPSVVPQFSGKRKKLCVLISGNKRVRHPKELYSERLNAIRWFEENHPSDFDLYGMGWDMYAFNTPLLARALNKIKPLRRLLSETRSSYRGTISSKLDVMKNYRFSICFENAFGIAGYITEKIFDSMAAGCIPVYRGAPNIRDFVPEDCFIDAQKFRSYEELYLYLQTMSDTEYERRLNSIRGYLESAAYKVFSPVHNARIVTETLIHAV